MRPLAFLLAAAILAAGCAPSPSPSPSRESTPEPTSVESPTATLSPSPSLGPSAEPSSTPAPAGIGIDGLPIDAVVLPIAVMIDDNAVARPQSGFNAASIVYQAPADGGEDRYMLVFQGAGDDIGPVRSGRPYFVYWAAEYRAGFAHYGGDEKTRFKVIPSVDRKLIYNLDALDGSGSAFHRISSRDAPHNAYTSWSALRATATRKGYPEAMVAGLASRAFKDDDPEADRPASGSISVPYGRGASSYTYDRATNSYLRSVAGKPQIDAADGRRVVAKDVVVLYMALSIDPGSEPGYHRPVLAQIGSGKAIVFRDGRALVGTWKKPDAGSLTRCYDSAGKEIELVRGRIFVQVVPSGTKVTYTAG